LPLRKAQKTQHFGAMGQTRHPDGELKLTPMRIAGVQAEGNCGMPQAAALRIMNPLLRRRTQLKRSTISYRQEA
ncbi:hypothetical protein, partial [Pelagicoccus mobilis]